MYGGDSLSYVGPRMPEMREYAEATAAEMDRAVRALLAEAYERARWILERERPLLDALASELVAHETIDAQQLDALLSARRAAPVSVDGRSTAGARIG